VCFFAWNVTGAGLYARFGLKVKTMLSLLSLDSQVSAF